MAVAITQSSFTFEVERQAHNSFKILDYMQKEGVLCDVTLVTKNVEIPAHKNVLASCSRYFYSMFTNYQTAKLERIELDVNPQVLSSVIKYMYTSKLTVLVQNVEDLLKVAKMLLLDDVEDECSNILERIMNANNCFHIKSLAVNYENPKLLSTASSYIDNNFVQATASEGFVNLPSDEIAELISRDTLKMTSEEKVYECIVRWINHDQKERRKYLRLLMGCVRLRFISKYYLRQHIVNDSFLRGDYHCKDLIINALLHEDQKVGHKTKPRRYQGSTKILLVVGGSANEANNTLEYYDFEKKIWSPALKMPFNVINTGLAAINHKVYVMGGKRDGRNSRTVDCWDVNTNNWNEINYMTTSRRTHGVIVLNNCIYAIGGYDGLGSFNSAEKFDFETQKWSPIAPMLTGRRYLGVGVLNDFLYAIGGKSVNNLALQSMECYDHRTNEWKELERMKDCRRGLGVCTLGGKLYAIGGHNGKQFLSSVEEYSPETSSWTVIRPMHVARYCPGVAAIDNKIYVTGGHNGDYALDSTEVYDKVTDSWRMIPQSMNMARSHHAAIIVDKKD